MAQRAGLTINADDFGIDRARDIGILLLAMLRGVDAVSAFAVSRYGESRRLRQVLGRLRPRIAVGLHVDLTDGPFQTEAMRHLFDKRIYPDKREFWSRAVAGDIAADCVAAEVRAQIAAFRQSFGFSPDHLDGHNHVHIAHPDIHAAFRAAQTEHGLPAPRVPAEDLTPAQIARLARLDEALPPDPVLDLLQTLPFRSIDLPLVELVERMRRSAMCDAALYDGAVRRLRSSGVDMGDCRFYGTFFGFRPSFAEAARIVRNARCGGDAEFMIHPGLNLGSSRRHGFSSRRRALEWMILALIRVAI